MADPSPSTNWTSDLPTLPSTNWTSDLPTLPSTNWTSDLPTLRAKPRAYGVGKYGSGKYSADPTRYAWTRVKATVGILLLFGSIALMLSSALAADTYTTNLNLRKPAVDVEDTATPWGEKINNNFDLIDAALWNIDTAKIKTDAIDSTKILTDAVQTNKIKDDSVTTAKIITGAVTTPKLADDSVTSAKVAFNYAGSSSEGGAATTASALAANGANCGAGNFPLGVDASGAAESCTDAATQAELDTHANATSAHSATSANTASRIVMRDASGNFTAGTIRADTGFNHNGAAGSSSISCSAGQVVGGQTVSGGIVTGGSCQAAGGSGDAVLSATQTFSGANSFTSTTTFKGPVERSTWVIVSVTPAAHSNTTLATANGVNSLTLNMSGGYAELIWNCSCSGSAANAWRRFTVDIDGTKVDGTGENKGLSYSTHTGPAQVCGFNHTTRERLSAGSHTFTLYIDTDGNSHTINPGADVCMFKIREQMSHNP